MNTGVYMIKNMITGKFYIGSAASDFKDRWKSDYNAYLTAAFKKYGKENFEFIPLQYCNSEDCIKNEQWWLDKLLFAQEYIKGEDKRFLELSYNFNPTAGSSLGFKHTLETRLLISKNGLGNKNACGKRGDIKTYNAKSVLKINKDNSIEEFLSVAHIKRHLKFSRYKILAIINNERNVEFTLRYK